MIAPIQFRIVIGSYKGHMTKTGGEMEKMDTMVLKMQEKKQK